MRRLARRSWLIALVALAGAGALVPGAVQAAQVSRPDAGMPHLAATKWTEISTGTGLGIASAGLLRTSDGKLHVVWPREDSSTSYSLHYSTVGAKAKLLATGIIVQKWAAVSAYPRLVPAAGGGMRLVFSGGNGVNGNPYDLGAMYTATSTSAGAKWTLAGGSMSQSIIVPLTNDAAVTESDGTPVAAWSGGDLVLYHAGIDPQIPAAAPDKSVALNPGSFAIGPALSRDSDGSVWMAWYTDSGKSDQGYWVDQLLPSKKAKVKAPGSGGANLNNNQPFESVAFAAGARGGLFLAYCVPTQLLVCAHVDLWREGAAKAAVLPGSATQHATNVAIAPAPGGHLWILWYDSQQNKIHVVRTNAAATKFSKSQTIAPPANLAAFNELQAEGSKGPLDVIALVLQNLSGSTPSYWDTQLLPKLTLTGSPSTVSHKTATTVTFKVTDVGDPVPGATVSFLGKTVKTNGKGVAQITVPKGTATGKHTATVTKVDYTPATFTVTVT